MSAFLQIAQAIAPSWANGPGARAVLFLQGCSQRCDGCHNASMQQFGGGRRVTVSEVARWYRESPGLRGLTLSGGEPFEQGPALAALCNRLRRSGADVVAFSGFTRRQLEADIRPGASRLLLQCDLLVDGPYDGTRPSSSPLLASSNQELHFLSGRIRSEEIASLPRTEWVGSGSCLTGFGIDAWSSMLKDRTARRGG